LTSWPKERQWKRFSENSSGSVYAKEPGGHYAFGSEERFRKIHENNSTDVPMEHFQFLAPDQPGIYYYSIGACWMDERRPNV
jgi:hypothetical protein